LLSQSMTAYAALVTLFPLRYLLGRLLSRSGRRAGARPVRQLAIEAGALAAMIAVGSGAMWLYGLRNLRVYLAAREVLWQRVPPQTESFAIRRDAYKNLFFADRAPVPAGAARPGFVASIAPPPRFVRIDATVLAFKHHFGWLGLVLVMAPFGLVGFYVVRAARAGPLAEADA